jgi:triacylglycerol lipase
MPSFDPLAQGLSLPNALLLGEAASTSYQEPAVCQRWAQDHGFDEAFDFFSNQGLKTDTNGFVAQNATSILVTFRGTDPKKPIDWFIDFNALKERGTFTGAKVHDGFADALESVWGQTLAGKQILPQRLLDRGNRAVWITGHSLGGALAELAAARAVLESAISVQGVYTFGQPRVGDGAFAQRMETALGARVFRFINNRDIVPRVPLFAMGYRHYGSEIFFNDVREQDNRSPEVEGLLAALRLAALGVNLNFLEETANLTIAVLTDRNAILNRESALIGDAKAVLAAGTENITDHSMQNSYLPLLSGGAVALGA